MEITTSRCHNLRIEALLGYPILYLRRMHCPATLIHTWLQRSIHQSKADKAPQYSIAIIHLEFVVFGDNLFGGLPRQLVQTTGFA